MIKKYLNKKIIIIVGFKKKKFCLFKINLLSIPFHAVVLVCLFFSFFLRVFIFLLNSKYNLNT